jgi:hypothetical protein
MYSKTGREVQAAGRGFMQLFGAWFQSGLRMDQSGPTDWGRLIQK